MALTAKFQADFSSFYKAVNDATAKLEGFQSEADQVSKSLDRMVDSLSGKKIISQATLMVKAVEEIGGAANLTDANLRKVGSTVAEASQAMERMGITVPQKFKDITVAAEGVKKPTESWAQSLGFLTGVVQGLMGLQIVGWLKDAAAAGFAWSGSMARMKAQTELSYRELQILEDVAISTSTGMDTLTKGIQVMQLKIGDRTAADAIRKLGINFDDLLRMSPADQFAAIARELAKIEDPTKFATAAFKIFGGTYRELTPAIRADLQAIAKDTKLVGDAQIDAAEKAASEWDKAWNDSVKRRADILGRLILLDKEHYQQANDEHADFVKRYRANEDYRLGLVSTPTLPGAPKLPTMGGAGKPGGIGAYVQDLPPEAISYVQILGNTLAEQTRQVGKNGEQWKALQEIQDRLSTSTHKLTLEQVKQIDTASKAGATSAEIAKAYGLNERAVAGYMAAQVLLAREIPNTNAALADFAALVSYGAIQSGLQQINRDTETLTGTLDEFIKRQQKQAIVFPDLTGKLDDFKKEWERVNGKVKESPPLFMALDKSLDDLAQGFAMLSQISGGSFGGVAKDIGKVIGAVKVASDSGKTMKEGLTAGGVEGYAQLATGAMGAIGAIDAATNSGNKAISVMGGMAAGAKAGMAFGPYGAAIGAAAGAITGFVKANMVEGKTVSPLRDAFFEAAGGLEVLNPQVEKLTGNLALVQAVFDAKTVDAYNAAIAELNGLFKTEQEALGTLTATAEKYGLTIEELGPAMQRQQLDKKAQELYKDWQILNAAGIQTTVITARMADAVNKYTNDAVRMGAEVPTAMRPMLEKMIEMGQLTDASGKKIDTLEGSGISFSLTMSEGLKALIGSVEKLADVLSRSLGTAIDSTTTKIGRIPNTVPVNIKYTESGAVPKSGGTVPGYATGTGGFVDFGAGTLAMLHGREAVIPESAVSNPTGGGGGGLGGTVTININAQGGFFDTPGDLQRLADKVNDALTAKYGLTNRNRAA